MSLQVESTRFRLRTRPLYWTPIPRSRAAVTTSAIRRGDGTAANDPARQDGGQSAGGFEYFPVLGRIHL